MIIIDFKHLWDQLRISSIIILIDTGKLVFRFKIILSICNTVAWLLELATISYYTNVVVVVVTIFALLIF